MADQVISPRRYERERAARLQAERIAEENSRALFVKNEELAKTAESLQVALERLNATVAELVRKEKLAALGDLVAGVAHEVNTPLGVAVTAVSHLDGRARACAALFENNQMKRSDLQAFLREVGEATAMTLANLARASDLVASFKRVAVNQASEDLCLFDLVTHLQDVLRSLQPRLRGTKATVRLDAPAALEVTSLPGAWSQILTNLVFNAVDHAFAPDTEGHVKVVVRRDAAEVELTVEDDGRGIAPEIREKVFEPFFTTRRSRGGSGLGLHIVHNLVTGPLHGSLRCTSELGHGAAFAVRSPVNLAPAG